MLVRRALSWATLLELSPPPLPAATLRAAGGG